MVFPLFCARFFLFCAFLMPRVCGGVGRQARSSEGRRTGHGEESVWSKSVTGHGEEKITDGRRARR